jgi:hypothetical protein
MAAPAKNSMSPGIRITISIIFALVIGIFSLFWNAGLFPNTQGFLWVGNLIIVPLIAVVMSFGSNCLIQQLSCGQIQFATQASRLWMTPILFYVMELVLFVFPALLWPIEGIFQNVPPNLQKGFSKGFYTFWMALYTQAFMNGLAQACPM